MVLALKVLEKVSRTDTSEKAGIKHLAELNKLLGTEYTLASLPEYGVKHWDDERLIDCHRQRCDLRIARQRGATRALPRAPIWSTCMTSPPRTKAKYV